MDRTRTQNDEDDTRNQGGDVTVDDGGVGVLVTVGDGELDALASLDFFLDTLEDDHVGVNGHTQGQHDTSDTRQGEHRAEASQHAEQEEHVHQQGDVGHKTSLVVEEHHVNQHEDEGEHHRPHTFLHGFLTERRANHLFLKDSCRSGQLTGFQDVGQVLGFFDGHAAARNLRTTAADFLIDNGIAINVVVEHDGHLLADVFAGEAFPSLGTFGVHLDGNFHLIALAEVLAGVGDDFAAESALVVARHFQGHQVEILNFALHDFGLHRPGKLQVAREDGLNFSQHLVDGGGVFHLGDTHTGGFGSRKHSGGVLIVGRLQVSKQRIVFVELVHLVFLREHF